MEACRNSRWRNPNGIQLGLLRPTPLDNQPWVPEDVAAEFDVLASRVRRLEAHVAHLN